MSTSPVDYCVRRLLGVYMVPAYALLCIFVLGYIMGALAHHLFFISKPRTGGILSIMVLLLLCVLVAGGLIFVVVGAH